MRRINFRLTGVMASVLVIAMAISVCVGVADVMAAPSRYYGQKQKCLNESGGRAGIPSVDWACGVAANQNISGCSLWIGQNSVVPTIYAKSKTEIVAVSYFGMCTDRVDTTSRVEVSDASTGERGFIQDGGAVTRQIQPAVGQLPTWLYVERFIAGLVPTPVAEGEAYTRTVKVFRCHSDRKSCSSQNQPITVIITGKEEEEEDDGGDDDGGLTEEQLCKAWMPSSYSNSTSDAGRTSVVEKVRNSRLKGEYTGWRGGSNEQNLSDDAKTTYAMPGDKIVWQGCYYPGVQKTAKKEYTTTHGADSGASDTGNTNTMAKDATTWQNRYVLSKWEGAHNYGGTFSDNSFDLPPNGPSSGDYNAGMSAVKWWSKKQNVFNTNQADAGRIYGIEMETGTPVALSIWEETHTWRDNCHEGEDGKEHCTTYTHSNPYYGHSLTGGTVQTQAKVEVPYNFVNDGSVAVSGTEEASDVVYSGERITVNTAQVAVNVKDNVVTEATYATDVDDARVRLVAFTSDTGGGSSQRVGNSGSNVCDLVLKKSSNAQCKVVQEKDGTLNEAGSLWGVVETFGWEGEYNAFDASAGDYMCFSILVYPSTSGVDRNLRSSGDDQWYVSAPACMIIAKRPNLQVYGGSLYTAGGIATSSSLKRNVWQVYDEHTIKGDGGNTTLFGSWVEEAVIANKSVNKLASGASLGFSNSNNNKTRSGAMGDAVGNYCGYLAPLSFANYGINGANKICNGSKGDSVGQANISAAPGGKELTRSALVDYWATGTVNVEGGAGVRLGQPDQYSVLSSASGVAVRYTRSNGDMNLLGGTVENGVTHLVLARDESGAARDIEITSDVVYGGGELERPKDIPQVVIYGNNIKIRCNVSRIDAVIIAEGNVNTCSDASEDINDAKRSRQLTIRGVVMSNSLSPERTYGNAWGTRSNMPAEAINYDTSSVLWGRFMAGSGESNTLNTVYQHEIAPRY